MAFIIPFVGLVGLYYLLRKKIRVKLHLAYPFSLSSKSTTLVLDNSIISLSSLEDNRYSFLNKSYQFKDEIDWNTTAFGKLWTYNLTYFDYLNQEHMTKEQGIELIHDFISKMPDIKDGFEPFPTSLRGMNWIKFLTKYRVEDTKIDDSLYAQYMVLMDNIEYHLLGNHLLENGFSLLFAAYYFKDEKLYAKATEILNTELEEQILLDGAHFELSPMYHQIMLYRVLDCINLLQNNPWKDNSLLTVLKEKASLMIGWIEKMTFCNGAIPLLNDSARKIAPTTDELKVYAKALGIVSANVALGHSGYRKIHKTLYECVVDMGNIGPDYIPGHAHSDTFSFELYIKEKPFIVDTGTSTYETNNKRLEQRSTKAHNTVMINDTEQSDVWDAFRVSTRAKVHNLIEKEDYISAEHDGYEKRFNLLHQREFYFNENSIKIVDTIHSHVDYEAVARIHFAPGVTLEKNEDSIVCDGVVINCSSKHTKITSYAYAPEFNKEQKAPLLEITFYNELQMEICI